MSIWTGPSIGITEQATAEESLGTLVWTAGVAPSGTIDAVYKYERIGSIGIFSIRIEASVGGTSVTQVQFKLPAKVDQPNQWASAAANDFQYMGAGQITNGTAAPAAGPNIAVMTYDGTNWQCFVISASVNGNTVCADWVYSLT